MPRRRKQRGAPPKPRGRRERPGEACWIESDSYDRARFAELRRDAPSFRELEEKGSVFLPHFPELLQDLFSALFKYNVIHLPESAVAPSARVNRVLLDGLLASAPYGSLRERTRLDEGHTGLGTILLGERALEALRSEKLFSRRDLLDHFELARDEEEMRRRLDELEHADETRGDPAVSDEGRE
ncbi:MAG: hypothetical protein ACREQ9_05720, partial [Candidatus Binatia bacterium]